MLILETGLGMAMVADEMERNVSRDACIRPLVSNFFYVKSLGSSTNSMPGYRSKTHAARTTPHLFIHPPIITTSEPPSLPS